MSIRLLMTTALLSTTFVVCSPANRVLADFVFSDSDFNEADWDVTVFDLGFGGQSSSGIQQASDGNPGSFRQIVNTIGQGPSWVLGFHRRLGAEFNPAVQGAIHSIDYMEDSITFDDAQATGGALRQDGDVFVALTRSLLADQSVWTSQSIMNLTATDFSLVDESSDIVDPTQNPDFSSTGSTIEWGFFRGNSILPNGLGKTATAGIDNWQVTVSPVPEPSSFAMIAGFAAITAIATARRRKTSLTK